MKYPGIHTRVLLTAVLIISFSTFVLGVIGVRTINAFVTERFEKRIDSIARYLALNAELGVLFDEKIMLSRLAADTLKEDDIAKVEILNNEKEIMASVGSKPAANYKVKNQNVLLREFKDGEDLFQINRISDESDTIIGNVRITYSTEGITGIVNKVKKRFAVLGVLLAFISCAVFYFISRSLVAPVWVLANAAKNISKGSVDIRVDGGRLPETRDLARAFNEMLDSLEKSRQSLQEAYQRMARQKTLAEVGKFSMMIAHEFKNPLGIIKSSMDMVTKEQKGLENNLMVAYIYDEIHRLNRLTEDFLMFAKPSEPVFSSTELNAMIEQLVDRFKIQYGEDEIRFNTHLSREKCTIEADEDLLSKAVSNILKNCAETESEKAVVEVQTFVENDKWHLEIADWGDGIPEENLETVFEPFFTTKAKGTGLGLAFSKQVVKAHGGIIYAQNRESGGAVFTLQLPL